MTGIKGRNNLHFPGRLFSEILQFCRKPISLLNRNIGLEKLGVCYHSGEFVVYEEMNFITNDTHCQPIEMKTLLFVACGRVWLAF